METLAFVFPVLVIAFIVIVMAWRLEEAGEVEVTLWPPRLRLSKAKWQRSASRKFSAVRKHDRLSRTGKPMSDV